MTLNVSISDFKTQFPRFSPEYLPVYVAGSTHFEGNIVYYPDTALFYECIAVTTTNLPTNTTDWKLYNDSVLNYTQDSDIQEAINEAFVNFNEGLFKDESTAKLVFLFLVAHYLTIDFGIALGSVQIGITTSKSVGSVSESYTIPNWLLNNPALSAYATTPYGIKYASLIRPYLIGNFFIAKGSTTFGN